MPTLTIASPLGDLVVTEEDGAIVSLGWLGEEATEGGSDETPVLIEARRQLGEYFVSIRRRPQGAAAV
ncbi:MAG: hypothetical protein FJX60_18500 [Alphaproteobacteria bacterium]|nr:hypothetical protein [Alphaproteobacteria bacterium]